VRVIKCLVGDPDLPYLETQYEWACIWLTLRLTENTWVDPEFGTKLEAKLLTNLRITLLPGFSSTVAIRFDVCV
jgi:hypothetical protein